MGWGCVRSTPKNGPQRFLEWNHFLWYDFRKKSKVITTDCNCLIRFAEQNHFGQPVGVGGGSVFFAVAPCSPLGHTPSVTAPLITPPLKFCGTPDHPIPYWKIAAPPDHPPFRAIFIENMYFGRAQRAENFSRHPWSPPPKICCHPLSTPLKFAGTPDQGGKKNTLHTYTYTTIQPYIHIWKYIL